MIGTTNYKRWPTVKRGEKCGYQKFEARGPGIVDAVPCDRRAFKMMGLLDDGGDVWCFLPCCGTHAEILIKRGEARARKELSDA